MMTDSKLIGRRHELEVLNRIYKSSRAEFLAVYGRRRIGKTFLISEFFKNKGYYFELTGTKDGPLKTQLNHFMQEFADAFFSGVKQERPSSWQEAFDQLRRKVAELDPNRKVIIFLDELPWLASKRSGILKSLEHVWNRYLSRLNNIILIVCGSAASWMLKKIIYNKGGLYGRLTAEICLKPFSLAETEQYLQAQEIHLDRKQLIELYFVFGGVAKYLTYISKGKSSAQTIAETCFGSEATLPLEFPKLYDSIFENPQHHIAIVQCLAEKKSGMTQEDILKKTGLTSGGNFTRILRELEDSGFIISLTIFSHKKKEKRYRLIDEYTLFYLTWIKPVLDNQLKSNAYHYWLSIQNSPSYTTWAGYAFEGICIKHVNNIIDALKITIVARKVSSWSYRPDQSSKAKGAQIDLVIDRADNCINLCEMKFSNSPFEITNDYAQKLRYKKVCFQEQTKTRKSLFTTMITPYGVLENQHSLSTVDSELTIDIFFS